MSLIVALLAGVAAANADARQAAGALAVRASNRPDFLLRPNDTMFITHTHITCMVSRRSPPSHVVVTCFRSRGGRPFAPAPGTYGALVSETGVVVEHFGTTGRHQTVFTARQPDLQHVPFADYRAAAQPFSGDAGRLGSHKNAFLNGTHVVCRNEVPGGPNTLLCGALDARGVVSGSYAVAIDDGGVEVFRWRNRRDWRQVFAATDAK